MIPTRELQAYLAARGLYHDAIDGDWGANSRRAARKLLGATVVRDLRVAVAQTMMAERMPDIDVGPVDGIEGPRTLAAWRAWVAEDRDTPHSNSVPATSHLPQVWPYERDVPSFFGERGENQVQVALPYPVKYVYANKTFNRMSLHKLVAESAQAALEDVWHHYGKDVYSLGLDLWGGSLNVRRKVGGTSWSMHSWGIAIDWDPQRNDLHDHAPKARLSGAQFIPWWEAWERQGWVSLGRTRNYDWMHVQAARF